MPANNALLLTDINFDAIKLSLRNFLSNQSELGDYDYDSSTMQILLNLLSYNTYINSYYLNMVGNEMFLDSAQIRSNVVSRAKMLGYTPRSAQGATATVQAVITPNDSPDTITISENSTFTSTIDGEQYVFVNPNTVVVNANADGIFSTNIEITEGRPLTFRYTVSSAAPVSYVIPNQNVDTRSISVQVQQSISNTSVETFTKATNLTTVTGNSAVFFLEENANERYELFFGDNVLGKAVNDGNIVIINYRVCNGSATNGASTFRVTSLGGYSDVVLTNLSAASGGAEKETLQSIKFNAPKNYETQNRAVTAKDYENLIKSNFGFVQSAAAWGGEDNSPPIYGKVYLSCKPTNTLLLSDTQKSEIIDFLRSRNVVSVEPEIVDPTFLYVIPTITVKYNPSLTSSTAGSLTTAISNRIINFESTQLGIFGQKFINSEFIKDIYRASDSFTSVQSELRLMKKFVPVTNEVSTYTINFNRSLLNITGGTILRGIAPTAHPGRGLTVDSSKFTYDGQPGCKFDDDGFGHVRIYFVDAAGVRVYKSRDAGSINYDTGLIKLNNLLITAYEGTAIDIKVDPDANDIDTIRNQLILINSAKVSLYNDELQRVTSTLSNINTQGNTKSIKEDAIISTVF